MVDEIGTESTRDPLDHARARHGCADHERAANNDDDIVAKAFEGLIGGYDANYYSRKQRDRRHKVVPPPTPDEQRHHDDDDGESQPLSERHECLANPLGEGLSAEMKPGTHLVNYPQPQGFHSCLLTVAAVPLGVKSGSKGCVYNASGFSPTADITRLGKAQRPRISLRRVFDVCARSSRSRKGWPG